jgi:hypothetical protein
MDTGARNQLSGDALLLQELTRLSQTGDESAQRVLGGWDRKDPVQLRHLMVLPPPSKTHFLTRDFREMRKRVVQEGFRLTKAFELNNLIRDKQWQSAAMCTLLEESAAAW